jgi:hypothetical protein
MIVLISLLSSFCPQRTFYQHILMYSAFVYDFVLFLSKYIWMDIAVLIKLFIVLSFCMVTFGKSRSKVPA